MAEIDANVLAFLNRAGWGSAVLEPLAGDASARRYWRVSHAGAPATAVLMQADPAAPDSLRAFLAIDNYLRKLGLSAPEILAEDQAYGFLLLEDLGDLVFARLLDAEPGREADLYQAAVGVLDALHHAEPPPGLSIFGPELMAAQAALVYPGYRGNPVGKSAFQHELESLLAQHLTGVPTLLLRDYHAENLVWLPKRESLGKVGLLDFQDAMIGPPGYDLVSLLHDVRRDVRPDLAGQLIAEFAARTGQDAEEFAMQCALLSAQRNLRILGVFARLSREQGKLRYIDLIPRTWAHLERALRHPVLSGLAARVLADLPRPDRSHLNRLREPCVPSRP